MKHPPIRILFVITVLGFAFSAKAIPLVVADFEDLNPGALVGQAGGTGLTGTWSVSGSSAPQVAGTGLTYTASDGGVINGGTRSVTSPGSGDWINRTLDGSVDLAQTIYIRYLVQGGGTLGTQELFSRYAGWNTYGAIKFNGNTQENRIGAGDNTPEVDPGGLDLFETYLVVDRLSYDGTNWNSIASWINPLRGDQSSPLTSHADGTESPANLSVLDFRLQNDVLIFDEFVIATEWEDVVPDAIPEPSVLAFTLAAIVMGIFLNRRC